MVATKTSFPLLFLMLLWVKPCPAQTCGSCKTVSSVAQYDLDVQVPQPEMKGEQTVGWLEWLQLFWLAKHANAYLSANNKECIRFTQPMSGSISKRSVLSSDGIEIPALGGEADVLIVGQTYTNLPPAGDLSQFGDYLISGRVTQQGQGYLMTLELQTACSRKTVASATVAFNQSASTEYMRNISIQAAAQLSPLAEKIKQFELKERSENANVAISHGVLESISINPKKRVLATGDKTELEIRLTDCDGRPLANRTIVFTKQVLNGSPTSKGTTGGTVSPATVITDESGKAKALFTMGNNKTALIEACHIYHMPNGCEGLMIGSSTIGNIPVRIEVSYFQNETKTLTPGTLPGVKVIGGGEIEQTIMFHTTIAYHYPSLAAIKKGFLLAQSSTTPEKGSRTEFVAESGSFHYNKKVQDAIIKMEAKGKSIFQAAEAGSASAISGYGGIQHPSEFFFFTGDKNQPATFYWHVEYPASPEGEIAYGGMTITKGEEGVEWTSRKITDAQSPYKTEHLLRLRLDAAKELKKGNQALKDLFGINLDEMATVIDPTAPKKDMATASGTQELTVRILSPYESP